MSSSVLQETLDEHFNELLSAISHVIDEPLQFKQQPGNKNTSAKTLAYPVYTKGLLISIKTKQSLHKNYATF